MDRGSPTVGTILARKFDNSGRRVKPHNLRETEKVGGYGQIVTANLLDWQDISPTTPKLRLKIHHFVGSLKKLYFPPQETVALGKVGNGSTADGGAGR